jgi:signal transduction histidine kinase
LVAAAHELKTPLVLLRQLSLQIGDGVDSGQPDKNSVKSDDPIQTNNFDVIARRMRLTSERALRLVDNLTRGVRLDPAQIRLEPVQLGGLLRQTTDELWPLADSLGQTFSVKLARRPLVAVANRGLLRALLINLLENALNYNLGKPIELGLNRHQASAELSVRDYGTPLDLGEWKSLENHLGKSAQPLSERPLSSGLGLLIADKFARAMRGRLTMRRHHGGGLTFAVSLPLSEQLSLL